MLRERVAAAEACAAEVSRRAGGLDAVLARVKDEFEELLPA